MPFVDTGSYPTRGGNQIRPWIDGEPAFRRICEAIEAAQHSVWVTVTFMWSSFEMPDDRGTALDVLERAARRGIDVRIIFWRPDDQLAHYRKNAFWGSAGHIDLLAQRHPHLNVRWDRAPAGYCQHQKTWLVDATHDAAAMAFVGGINLNPHSMVAPGHRGEGHNHDIYIELAGPAVADVHHNFAQRWNEASERARDDGRWGNGSEDSLAFPNQTPAVRGRALVQIQRTIPAGCYTEGHPPSAWSAFEVARGERTNLEQYCAAIGSARRTIYVENQYIEVPEIVAALADALKRGIQVILLLPAMPELSSPSAAASLASYDNVALCGIAGLDDDGQRKPVYVHAKIMLVDDAWATVGSCNLHRWSLSGNGELNAAFWDPVTVRALRVELFQEHLAMDTSDLDDTEALLLFRRIARDNRQRHERRDPHWQGLAFSLDMATYGHERQF